MARSDSAQGLNFAVPINYVRRLLNSLHEPVTLEQMRTSLGAMTGLKANNDGPSLKETLDWLKQRLPLGVVSLVERVQGVTTVHEYHLVVWKFDTCVADFGYASNVTILLPSAPLTIRYTVPLDTLTQGSITLVDHPFRIDPDDTFIYGDKQAYKLVLSGTAKTFLSSIDPHSAYTPPSTMNVPYIDLLFNDEQLAQKVEKAFLHAADLCRGKEPF